MQPVTPSQVTLSQSKLNATFENINQASSEKKLILTAHETISNLSTLELKGIEEEAQKKIENILLGWGDFSKEEIEHNNFIPIILNKKEKGPLTHSKITSEKPNAIFVQPKKGPDPEKGAAVAQILTFDNTDPSIREEIKALKNFTFEGVTYNVKLGKTLSSDKIELFTRAYLIHQTATQILKIKESKEKEAQKEKKPEATTESQQTYDKQDTITDNKKQDIKAEEKEALIRKVEAQQQRHQIDSTLRKLVQEFEEKMKKLNEQKKEEARQIERDEIKRDILKREIKQIDLNSETTHTEEKIDAFFPKAIAIVLQEESIPNAQKSNAGGN